MFSDTSAKQEQLFAGQFGETKPQILQIIGGNTQKLIQSIQIHPIYRNKTHIPKSFSDQEILLLKSVFDEKQLP